MLDTIGILAEYAKQKLRPMPRSRRELEAVQERKFQSFASRVLVKSPFYASYVGKPLSSYPLMSKQTMVGCFNEINTAGLNRDEVMNLALQAEETRDFSPMIGDIAVGLSSGTSGSRGIFVVSPAERRKYLGVALAKCLPGSILKPYRIALLLRSNNNLYEEAAKSGRISFKFFDLMRPIQHLAADLVDYQPDIIIAPPQTLLLMADVRNDWPHAINPARIFSCAEVLHLEDQRFIEQAFATPVHQLYQATEGFLGSTCRYDTLHLHEDHLHIEKHWVDKRAGRFIPIITDLNRSTQPFVRYKLDDILIEQAGQCPCGSVHTAIKQIDGRFDDVLVLPSRISGELVPIMPDFIRNAMANLHAEIGEYRVIQEDIDLVHIKLTAPEQSPLFQAAQDALETVFTSFDLEVPYFTFESGIDTDLMMKTRRVQRRFEIPMEQLWQPS